MPPQLIASYPLIAASTKTDEEDTGVIKGEHGSTETTKKIWTAAEERRIEDNVHNRELAYEIDPLVKFIVNIKRFSILKNYIIASNDDTKHAALITTITTFIDDIKLMSRFRQSFTPLQIHGSAHLQKLTKGKSLSSLSLILNLEKYTNPLNASKYYYYQKLEVSKDWLNPEEPNTQTQKVWYIDLKDEEKFTAIDKGATVNKTGDKVFARDLIIEILNNDAGESNIHPIISQIFIKNFLIAHLPNLITIVTSPDEELIYKTRDAAGNYIVPQMPPASLQSTDSVSYNDQLDIYNTWKSSLQTLADQITSDRMHLGKTIHPDDITEKIVGSSQSLNSDMIDVLVRVLDTQIAYGMGFSLSLINASGVELSTSRNIYSTIAVTLRGIQEQYEHVAQDIINDQFSEAAKAGITFSLGELNPADENEVATTKKIYAEITEILYNMGLSSEQTNNFMSKYIDETLEMEMADISEEATEAAVEAIGAMEDYVDLVNDNTETGKQEGE
jgi:hypothetical protein